MIAIIPARGGSKGVPRKNVRSVNGKPLIAYTIEAAIAASTVDRVIVSTDDEEIASIACQYGAEVPFMRPDELATDSARAADAYLYTVERLERECGISVDKFIVLLPTAPLRTAEDIDAAVAIMRNNDATTVVSMAEAEIPPAWYYSVREDGSVRNAGFEKANEVANRQDNQTYLVPNGAIYILDHNLLKNTKSYYDDTTMPYVMPASRSVDIDTEEDLAFARYLLSLRIVEE